MADILRRKTSAFLVWRPKPGAAAPVLVIGKFAYGNPPVLAGEHRIPLSLADGFDDLFAVDASGCGLLANTVYHYWFEVDDTSPGRPPNTRVLWPILSPGPLTGGCARRRCRHPIRMMIANLPPLSYGRATGWPRAILAGRQRLSRMMPTLRSSHQTTCW